MKTLSLTTIGASVPVWPFEGSPSFTDQTTCAGLRVERDESGVRLMEEDFAVGVGQAAIDRVAAHHRDDVRILLGLIFPEDLAVVVEVERKNGVRERRMKNITSPMTSGAPSWPRKTPVENVHAGASLRTFSALICLSSE